MNTILGISNLSKKFGSVQALKNVSLNIKEKEFYGLLGPNGAGKTTTINIISTVLEPDMGTVSINNFDLKKDPVKCKKSIGVVPQEIALYNEFSAYENLMFWGGLYDISTNELKKRIDETLYLFGLKDRGNNKIKSYSGGMKRRINIAAALLHSPKILLMDEPTVGIDPQSRNLIFEVLAALHERGITIIYTTHYMEEAERLCDRIGIIDQGEIIAEGSLDDLRLSHNADEYIIFTLSNLSDIKINQVKEKFDNILSTNENSITFTTKNSNKDMQLIISGLSETGLEINNIEIQRANLETIFLNLTGRKLRD